MARTVLAGLFAIGLSALAVPAPAQAAEGYASVDVNVTISDVTQIGGRKIRVHAVARTEFGDPVNCSFTIVFGGDSSNHVHVTGNTGNGSEFDRTFNTSVVPRDLTGFAVARCTYDDATVSGATVPSALQTASSDPGQVNLLALDDDSDDSDSDDSDSDDSDSDDSDDNGGLPNTGGERLLWLLIGLALVAGGTTVILSSRDRDAEA